MTHCSRKASPEPADFLQPEPAPDEDVLRVHTAAYVHKLQTDSLTLSERMKLEIPLLAGDPRGILAGGRADQRLPATMRSQDGFAANLSGGFHHAYPGHGEGFCMIHDVGMAIRSLQAAGKIRTAMTVDTDVHHGNGTAAIFADDDSVFTLSIHQENNYPMPKPPSDEDIGLADGTRDHEYLDALEEALLHALKKMTPDIIFYVGGADPYREDQLGGLALTIEGLQTARPPGVRARPAEGNSGSVNSGGRICPQGSGHGSNPRQHNHRRAQRSPTVPPCRHIREASGLMSLNIT